MIVLYKVIGILIIFINYSYANDIDIQKQLDAQKEIIDEQAKRIDQLEIIIEELKTVLPHAEINNATINSDKKNENETSSSKTDDIISASKNKKYNPETAFFGPLPQLRSKDGKYSAGIMGLI